MKKYNQKAPFALKLTILILLLFIAGILSAQKQNRLSRKEIKNNWILLFNGESFEGWRGINNNPFPEKAWKIKDNSIFCTGEVGGDIISEEMFSDFVLTWEWKMVTPGANSGIKYFVVEYKGDKKPFGVGIEYQLLDDRNHEWMKNEKMKPNDFHTLGAAYELYAPSSEKKSLRLNKWNSSKIISKNGKVEHWLNGKKILEFDRFGNDFKQKVATSKFSKIKNFGLHPEGHILLQNHSSKIYLRNIKIKKL